ncbi:hypothetical protein BGX26_000517, partial [Mortierella sp. AD094]
MKRARAIVSPNPVESQNNREREPGTKRTKNTVTFDINANPNELALKEDQDATLQEVSLNPYATYNSYATDTRILLITNMLLMTHMLLRTRMLHKTKIHILDRAHMDITRKLMSDKVSLIPIMTMHILDNVSPLEIPNCIRQP